LNNKNYPALASVNNLELITSDIIKGCVAQNRKSQERLYHLCHKAMLKVCCLYVANIQDAAALYNQAMLKVFAGIDQYRAAGAFMGWVRRIVVNTCIDHCRRQQKFVLQSIEAVAEENYQADPSVYDKLSAADTLQLVHELPAASAMVFTLYAIEGYKHAEIAVLLSISEGTSKWHLNEARRLLKQKIDQHISNNKIYYHAG
jgi:RNA polymerase sigma-70 factor, ECF subfamily